MSKKCCGLIYADEDTVCKICGKALSEDNIDIDTDIEGQGDEEEAPEEAEEENIEEKDKINNADRASGGVKVAGVVSIIIAAFGMAAVVLSILIFVIFPIYDKSDMDGRELSYPEIATSSDVMTQSALLTPSDVELNTFFDDATVTDATKEAASSEQSE